MDIESCSHAELENIFRELNGIFVYNASEFSTALQAFKAGGLSSIDNDISPPRTMGDAYDIMSVSKDTLSALGNTGFKPVFIFKGVEINHQRFKEEESTVELYKGLTQITNR